MKKFFNYFALVAIATLTLAGCSKNDQNAPDLDGETLHVKVKASAQHLLGSGETKTYIDTYDEIPNTILWGENEYMTIMVQSGETQKFATSKSDNASLFNGEKEAIFEFEITPETSDSYIYGGVYPASCAINWNASTPYNDNTKASEFKVYLPSTQKATANSYDPDAYIMVAKPTSFIEPQTEWTASYRRATALNKITLTNIPEDIESVEITAPTGKYLAGRRKIDLTTGNSGELYGQAGADTRTETIEVKTNLTGDNKVVWFTSWEVLISENEELKIVAKSATKSYTRTLTARSGGINFKEGYLNTLKVNMSTADVETLEDYSGNYLILANNSGWQIMSSTLHENNYFVRVESGVTGEDVDFESFSSIPNIDNYIWAVSKVENGYTVKNTETEKYLTLTADVNNAFYSEDPETFELSISDDGQAVIKSLTYSTRVLRYNSSSPRFAFYKGTQQPIYMIKAVSDSRTPVTMTFGESVINKTILNYNEFTGQTVTANPSVSDITYTWSGDNIGSVVESTGIVSLNGSQGTATVTAFYAGSETYKPATAHYTINVTDSKGTQENPYTASEAIAKAETLGTETIADVYVKGIVCTTGSVNTQYNSVTYYISNDGSTTNRFEVYSGKYVDGANFTDENNVKLGDFVIVKGTLKYYSKGNQAEFDYNNEIVSILRAPVFNPDGGTFASPQSVTIYAETGATVYYTTDGTTPTTSSSVYSSAISISETTTIKAFAVKDGNTTGIVERTFTKTVPSSSTTATITFGNSGVKINAASVTGIDSGENTWTITTEGTTSFTQSSGYSQVGSGSKPATSITFTTTLPSSKKVTNMSAKFGGFSGTAGTVTLKVGDNSIGSGSLSGSSDVTVTSTTTANGTVLTVTVTGISKGVKVYNISVTYE